MRFEAQIIDAEGVWLSSHAFAHISEVYYYIIKNWKTQYFKIIIKQVK